MSSVFLQKALSTRKKLLKKEKKGLLQNLIGKQQPLFWWGTTSDTCQKKDKKGQKGTICKKKVSLTDFFLGIIAHFFRDI